MHSNTIIQGVGGLGSITKLVVTVLLVLLPGVVEPSGCCIAKLLVEKLSTFIFSVAVTFAVKDTVAL